MKRDWFEKSVIVAGLVAAMLCFAAGFYVAGCDKPNKPPEQPDDTPAVVEEQQSDWDWIRNHCWEAKLNWHHQTGYTLLVKYETPKHPIGSLQTSANGDTFSEVCAAVRAKVAANL